MGCPSRITVIDQCLRNTITQLRHIQKQVGLCDFNIVSKWERGRRWSQRKSGIPEFTVLDKGFRFISEMRRHLSILDRRVTWLNFYSKMIIRKKSPFIAEWEVHREERRMKRKGKWGQGYTELSVLNTQFYCEPTTVLKSSLLIKKQTDTRKAL